MVEPISQLYSVPPTAQRGHQSREGDIVMIGPQVRQTTGGAIVCHISRIYDE